MRLVINPGWNERHRHYPVLYGQPCWDPVRVDYGEDFNSHSLRFSDANVFRANVDNEIAFGTSVISRTPVKYFSKGVEGVT
ncbi:MAG: hypothetical protein CM1200mP22_27980 [Dehalococcoidia bacterium]|nr:MAG: hypothetical protein CM1200mP22_27980 [Dehalococcoidia bacterium]